MKRVWFLRNGNHLCRGLAGAAGDEYGRKTVFLHLPGGVLVIAVRDWTYAEILADEGGDRAMADRFWAEYAEERAAAGLPPRPGDDPPESPQLPPGGVA